MRHRSSSRTARWACFVAFARTAGNRMFLSTTVIILMSVVNYYYYNHHCFDYSDLGTFSPPTWCPTINTNCSAVSARCCHRPWKSSTPCPSSGQSCWLRSATAAQRNRIRPSAKRIWKSWPTCADFLCCPSSLRVHCRRHCAVLVLQILCRPWSWTSRPLSGPSAGSVVCSHSSAQVAPGLKSQGRAGFGRSRPWMFGHPGREKDWWSNCRNPDSAQTKKKWGAVTAGCSRDRHCSLGRCCLPCIHNHWKLVEQNYHCQLWP